MTNAVARRTRSKRVATSTEEPVVRKRIRPTTTTVKGRKTKFEGLDGIAAQLAGRGDKIAMRRANVIHGFCHTHTGIFILDMGLLGGIAEGLVTQIYGWEATGKTTIAMRVAANMQIKYPDKAVVFVDAEQTFDPIWAAHHGIDLDRLFLITPESGEQAVDIVEAVLKADETALVIIDSLPALVPQKEKESSAEDSLVASRSRLIGRLCSKILAATRDARAAGNNPTTIFINQFRMKIGVSFGDPRTLPGGMQPKYISTTMIETKKKGETMGKDEYGIPIVEYNDHAFAIKKSKVGNSLKEGEFKMVRDPSHRLGQGAIDESRTVINFAKKMGIVSGGGATWRLDGVDQVFGRLSEIEDFLIDDHFEYDLLKARIVAERRMLVGHRGVPVDGLLMGVEERFISKRMGIKF